MQIEAHESNVHTLLEKLRFRKQVAKWNMDHPGHMLTVEANEIMSSAYLLFETNLEAIEFKLRYM